MYPFEILSPIIGILRQCNTFVSNWNVVYALKISHTPATSATTSKDVPAPMAERSTA